MTTRKPVIKIFYDTETTGTNYKVNSVHSVGMIIEVDDVVTEELCFYFRPHPKAQIEQGALDVAGVTLEQIMSYPDMKDSLKAMQKVLSKYINKYDMTNKALLVGYNNRGFDDFFFRKTFELCDDYFIGSWFWNNTIDVLCLATEYLIDRRPNMLNFKLGTVAKELGLTLDDEGLHDAVYDAKVTRDIYRIVTGREIEI